MTPQIVLLVASAACVLVSIGVLIATIRAYNDVKVLGGAPKADKVPDVEQFDHEGLV